MITDTKDNEKDEKEENEQPSREKRRRTSLRDQDGSDVFIANNFA